MNLKLRDADEDAASLPVGPRVWRPQQLSQYVKPHQYGLQ